MRTCPECGETEENRKFYPKSEHCQICNLAFYENQGIGELLRRFYQPEYPPHIQEYLDKRKERLGIA